MGTVSDIFETRSAELVSALSRQHGAQLLRFLRRMLREKDLVEGVAQEAYRKVLRLSRPGETIICPRAVLFDVATKLAIDRLRQKRAGLARSTTEPVEINAVPDDAPLPDCALLAEAMQRLTTVVDDLPPTLRQVFIMRFVKQLPRAEIAKKLNLSIDALEQRLTGALTRCREKLAAHGIDWIA